MSDGQGGNDRFDLTEEEYTEQQKEIAAIQEQLEIEKNIKKGAEAMMKLLPTEELSKQIKSSEAKITSLHTHLQELKSSPAAIRRALKIKRHKRLEVGAPGLLRRISERAIEENASETAQLKRSSSSGGRRSSEGKPEYGAQITGYITSLAKTTSPQVRLDILSKFAQLLKKKFDVNACKPVQDILLPMRYLLIDPVKEVRASAYRVVRHLVVDRKTVELIIKMQYEVLIARSLVRDQRMEHEREQSLKLVRSFLTVPGGAQLIPRSAVSALVAIAEEAQDKMHTIALETLMEISLHNLELVAHAGGLKPILAALQTATTDQTNAIVTTCLTLVDREVTRRYIRRGVDFEVLLASFTDANNKGPACEEATWAASAQGAVTALKSWTGIIYLCASRKNGAQAIVDALLLPFEDTRKQLLDLLFEVFKFKAPMWSVDFLSALRRTVDYHLIDGGSVDQSIRARGRQDLVENYLAVLVKAFIDARLVETLIEIMKDTNRFLAVRATILLGEVMNLANRLLPPSISAKIQVLPALFELGIAFDDEIMRNAATSAISHLEKLQRAKEQLLANDDYKRFYFVSPVAAHVHRQERIQFFVKSAKARMSQQIDAEQFQSLVRDSLLLTEKNYEKWNWDIISELLDGPLLNPRRFEEAVNSKFLKKLITFFLPLAAQFADCKRQHGESYARVGCQLIETCLASPEGLRFLAESELLSQFAACLEELDPMIGSSRSDEALFSPGRMANTMSSEYFALIGIMTTTPEGIQLLKKFKIFSSYYYLTELKSRDDLIRSIITSMDYSFRGHPRIILSKVLNGSSKRVRLYATDYLRQLFRADVSEFADWGVRFLYTQTFDPVVEVCEKAMIVLEEAISKPENLAALVKLRPNFDHLLDLGSPLIVKLLSSDNGFKYLQESGYVDRELNSWFTEGNEYYVQQLEFSLTRALSTQTNPAFFPYRGNGNEMSREVKETDGTVPPHFFGELAKTEAGCAVLTKSGHLKQFARIVREYHPSKATPSESEMKAALWALGHIGSSRTGFALLADADLFKDLVAVCEQSTTLSLRGTGFYVLGLLSRTAGGVAALRAACWEATPERAGESRSIVMPTDLGRLLSVPPGEFRGSLPLAQLEQELPREEDHRDPIANDIFVSVGNLSNHIVANSASKELTKLRTEVPHYFQRSELYHDVLQVLYAYRFKLNAHRFVHELFDRVLLNEEALSHWKTPGRKFTPAIIADLQKLNKPDILSILNLSQQAAQQQQQQQQRTEEGGGGGGAGGEAKPQKKAVALEPKKVVVGFSAAPMAVAKAR